MLFLLLKIKTGMNKVLLKFSSGEIHAQLFDYCFGIFSGLSSPGKQESSVSQILMKHQALALF